MLLAPVLTRMDATACLHRPLASAIVVGVDPREDLFDGQLRAFLAKADGPAFLRRNHFRLGIGLGQHGREVSFDN